MVHADDNCSTTAQAVDYERPSPFSRELKRLYEAVPEKLTLPAAVGVGHEICVVKIAGKGIFQDQDLAL